MMNRICLFVFIVLAFVFFLKIPCMAEGIYYTPEGTAVKKYSIQRTKKKEDPTPTSKKKQTTKKTQKKKVASKKIAPKQKTDTTKKKPLTAKEKMNAEAAAAVAAGYKVGQTVKVKDGIIYRLAKDPKTGAYTFKRYRRVKKKKTVVQETPSVDVKAKARAEADKKAAARARAEAEAILEEQAEVKAREEAAEKTRLEAEAQRKKEEREKKERRLYTSEKMKAKGRNMKRLKSSVSFRHSFLDTKTVITDRMLTVSDGETTTTEPVTDGVGQEDTYYTDMHNDLVRLRFGVTDSVELFVDAGIAYDQLSNITDMEPVFGGGFRVNILELDDGLLSGGYLAFSGEYLTGKLKMDYSDAGGLEYLKTTEWQDMTATLESGIVFSKFTLFAGCSYFMYSETITKKQIQPPPDITMLEDELEQQGNLNLSGGIEYHHSPSMHLLFEVQALNRQGGVLSFEYRF